MSDMLGDMTESIISQDPFEDDEPEYDYWPSHAVSHATEYLYDNDCYDVSVIGLFNTLAANNLFIVDYTHAPKTVKDALDEMFAEVDRLNGGGHP